MWLNEKGIGSCWEAFRGENFTSLSSLFSLSSDDLKDMGLKLGERKHFMTELDHLATYSIDRLRSMGVSDSGVESFGIAAKKFVDKVRHCSILLTFLINFQK